MSEDIRKGAGFGYKSKSGLICMIKCFKCARENYAMTVSSGFCAWCGHDANSKKPTKNKSKSK